MLKIKAKDMQLADVVTMVRGPDEIFPYSICTVKQIRDGMVTLFRPFVITNDFSYTSGVGCYIGIEEYPLHIDSGMEYYLLERKALK